MAHSDWKFKSLSHVQLILIAMPGHISKVTMSLIHMFYQQESLADHFQSSLLLHWQYSLWSKRHLLQDYAHFRWAHTHACKCVSSLCQGPGNEATISPAVWAIALIICLEPFLVYHSACFAHILGVCCTYISMPRCSAFFCIPISVCTVACSYLLWIYHAAAPQSTDSIAGGVSGSIAVIVVIVIVVCVLLLLLRR